MFYSMCAPARTTHEIRADLMSYLGGGRGDGRLFTGEVCLRRTVI